jgi:hypothetical protein
MVYPPSCWGGRFNMTEHKLDDNIKMDLKEKEWDSMD